MDWRSTDLLIQPRTGSVLLLWWDKLSLLLLRGYPLLRVLLPWLSLRNNLSNTPLANLPP